MLPARCRPNPQANNKACRPPVTDSVPSPINFIEKNEKVGYNRAAMAKKGRKGRKKIKKGWILLLVFLPLLILASLFFFEAIFERPFQRRLPKVSETKPSQRPRLAFIIDDGGYKFENLKGILNLGKPMTCAILPHTPHTRQAALFVHQRGGEVMLHLPMEPKEENGLALEKDMVKTDMPSPGIQKILREALRQIPEVRGMNPHMGSKATEDPRVMEAIMGVLKEGGLYYIDSHTSPHSAGMKAARAMGVPSAQNDKFIDAVKRSESIKEAIRIAMARAQKGGKATAIGHPDPLTLKSLQEMIPEIEKAGIKLVFTSEIVG
jgi:hypothetical protein